MNFKHKLNTLLKIFSTKQLVGWSGVFWNILQKTVKHLDKNSLGNKTYLYTSEKYANKVRAYLKKYYQAKIDAFKHYKNLDILRKNDAIIWTFWQQGEQKAPDIIKICLDSMKKCGTGHKIIVLDEKNLDDYCEIPSYIWDKYKQGILSVQQLSNILRYTLLCDNGGLWLDSTFYIAKEIPAFIFEMPWWMEKGTATLLFTRNNAKYFGLSAFASQKGNIVPAYMKTMFLEYWKKEITLIDYHLHNAWYDLGYCSIDEVKILIDAIPFNNPHGSELIKLQDLPFDKLKWQNITENGLAFFKMNWRKLPLNISGSFYDYMKKQV